jgi:small subunit ribosomal protein S4
VRREGINFFQNDKYDVKKRRGMPGQHGATMPRLSEYGKLLRNKQVLKRTYFMAEKPFAKLVKFTASRYAKNKGLSHDKVLLQFLERRLDAIVFRAGLSKTIVQARQMVTHGHFTLNGHKHNIPSYFVNESDVIAVREKVAKSPLFEGAFSDAKTDISRLKVNKADKTIEVLNLPDVTTLQTPVDVLKVIEFYARA